MVIQNSSILVGFSTAESVFYPQKPLEQTFSKMPVAQEAGISRRLKVKIRVQICLYAILINSPLTLRYFTILYFG